MVCYDQGYFDPDQRPYSCVFASQRRGGIYEHSHEEIWAKFGGSILMYEEMPAALASAMGDFAFIARFSSEDEAIAFAHYVLKRKEF
jgi:hypothetical protein